MDDKKAKGGKKAASVPYGRKTASGPVGAFLKGLSGR